MFIYSKLEEIAKAPNCTREVYELAKDLTRPGTRFIQVINRLDAVYAKYGLLEDRVIGCTHGVGLQVEEYPITTIIPAHRVSEAGSGMVLASVHSPLMLKKYGTLKLEDTFIVMEHELRPITKAWLLSS